MRLIAIKDTVEVIDSDRDIIDIIRLYCGSDFASFVEYRLNHTEVSDEQREEILKDSDFYSYEASLDEWNCCGNDIIEECESQLQYIEESKRIDRNRIDKSFRNIQRMIHQIL